MLKLDELKRASDVVLNSFSVTRDVEMTLEANPATLTIPKIEALRSMGFSRVSLGVQSFDNQVLRRLNCAHTGEKAKQAIYSLLEHGLVVNIDMF